MKKMRKTKPMAMPMPMPILISTFWYFFKGSGPSSLGPSSLFQGENRIPGDTASIASIGSDDEVEEMSDVEVDEGGYMTTGKKPGKGR